MHGSLRIASERETGRGSQVKYDARKEDGLQALELVIGNTLRAMCFADDSLSNLPAASNADLAQQLSELNITGLGSGQNPRDSSSGSAYPPQARDLPDLGTSLATRHPMGMVGKAFQNCYS